MSELTDAEYAQLTRTMRSSSTALVVMSVLFGCLVIVAIVSAIVVAPTWLRVRISTNEATALSTLTRYASAGADYAEANQGGFGTVECLVDPADCLPEYTGDPFVIGPAKPFFDDGVTVISSPREPSGLAAGGWSGTRWSRCRSGRDGRGGGCSVSMPRERSCGRLAGRRASIRPSAQPTGSRSQDRHLRSAIPGRLISSPRVA